MTWNQRLGVATSNATIRNREREMRESFRERMTDRRYVLIGADVASADLTAICTIEEPITLTVFFSKPHDGEVQE